MRDALISCFSFFFFEVCGDHPYPPKRRIARRRRTGKSRGAKKAAKSGGVVVVGGSKVEPSTTYPDRFHRLSGVNGSTLEPSRGWSG